MRRFRTACESAKRMLSTSTTAAEEVAALFEGVDFSTTVSRAKFVSLNEEPFIANPRRHTNIQEQLAPFPPAPAHQFWLWS